MSRVYHGIDLNIADPKLRDSLTEIDIYLRDLSRAMSENEPDTIPEVNKNASFLVLSLHAGLTSERRFTTTSPLNGSDGGAGGNYTLSLAATAATPQPVGSASVGSGPNRSYEDHSHALAAGTAVVDRLTSYLDASSTLILGDDSTNQQLTGSLGNLEISAAGGVDFQKAIRVPVHSQPFGMNSIYVGMVMDSGTNGSGMFVTRNNPANEPFLAFSGWDSGSQRTLYFGGGGWGGTDPTDIRFYSDPSYGSETIDGGTLRLQLGGGVQPHADNLNALTVHPTCNIVPLNNETCSVGTVGPPLGRNRRFAEMATVVMNISGELNHDGSTAGFFGATPAVQAGATDDIKDALTSYGLLQGTSATPLNLDGGKLTCNEAEIDGALNHDGTTLGFYGNVPAAQQSATVDIKDALTTYGLLTGTSATPLNLDGGAFSAGSVNSAGAVVGNTFAISGISSGATTDWTPQISGLDLGLANQRWDNAYLETGPKIHDQNDTTVEFVTIRANSTTTLTVDRVFTIDVDNADRTLSMSGNLTIPAGSAYTPTNVTTDRSYDANSTTLDEIADVLGTLIADLQSAGVIL